MKHYIYKWASPFFLILMFLISGYITIKHKCDKENKWLDIPAVCITACATLCAGTLVTEKIEKIDKNKLLADKIYNYETKYALPLLCILDELNLNDIRKDKILVNLIKIYESQKEQKGKLSLTRQQELDLFKQIKDNKISSNTAYKKYIHDFCKLYTIAYEINQLTDEDKNDICSRVNQAKKFIDGGGKLIYQKGIYKYLNE